MSFFITFKLSAQDHVETFFSLMRGACGRNNNPLPYMFRCILRKLIYSPIKNLTRGNCSNEVCFTVFFITVLENNLIITSFLSNISGWTSTAARWRPSVRNRRRWEFLFWMDRRRRGWHYTTRTWGAAPISGRRRACDASSCHSAWLFSNCRKSITARRLPRPHRWRTRLYHRTRKVAAVQQRRCTVCCRVLFTPRP